MIKYDKKNYILILIICFSSFNSLAQTNIVENWTPSFIKVKYGDGPVCFGDTITVIVPWAILDSYPYTRGSFGYEDIYNFVNAAGNLDAIKSRVPINVVGSGVISHTIAYSDYNPESIIIKILPTQTTNYNINWTIRWTYSSDPIFARDIPTTRIYNGNFTIVVINPPKANIISNKSVAEINENILLSAEGCPVSTPAIPVKYQFAESTSCDENNIIYIEDSEFSASKNRNVGSSNPIKKHFKVRCKVADCIGEYSEPISIRIIEKPTIPSPNCNLGEVDESGYFPNRSDFHRYQLAKEICDKSTDPDCTVDNVFNLLKSQQKNSIPQYKDFPPEAFAFMTGSVVSSGLQNQYYYSNIPSSNCQQTGVYSPFSSYFLVKGPFPCLNGSNGGYFWDPITQFIDSNSRTITNFTLPGHTLHPGKVMISIKEDNCKVFGQVIGMGNSNVFNCWESLGEILSKRINVNTGLYAFNNLLERLKKLYDSKAWK